MPDMYGKNLTFKTGGVDGCDCEETLKLVAEGKLDTEPLITHTYPLSKIDEAYELFENKRDGVIKVAVKCERETKMRLSQMQNAFETASCHKGIVRFRGEASFFGTLSRTSVR